ncbi:MAG: hypothetical protein WCH41_06285 [Methylophilaceae bacterium]|jgi:hypothetical protein
MKLVTFALLFSLSSFAFAQAENKTPAEIPTNEKDFISTIDGFEKAKIIEQLGQPSKIDEIASAAGKPVASIWQYHYLNTDEKGEYYQTTELDFLDDKVVMVVFMNNDGSEIPADAVKSTPQKK